MLFEKAEGLKKAYSAEGGASHQVSKGDVASIEAALPSRARL